MNPIILSNIHGNALILKYTVKQKIWKRRLNYVDLLLLPMKRHSLN